MGCMSSELYGYHGVNCKRERIMRHTSRGSRGCSFRTRGAASVREEKRRNLRRWRRKACCGGSLVIGRGLCCVGEQDMTGDNAGLRRGARGRRIASDCNDSCQSTWT
jgi:hypothetical protein